MSCQGFPTPMEFVCPMPKIMRKSKYCRHGKYCRQEKEINKIFIYYLSQVTYTPGRLFPLHLFGNFTFTSAIGV